MSADNLTTEERAAIASLRRLAKRWPRSLTLFSWSGSLVVFHASDKAAIVEDSIANQHLVLAEIDGIPNDGGDP